MSTEQEKVRKEQEYEKKEEIKCPVRFVPWSLSREVCPVRFSFFRIKMKPQPQTQVNMSLRGKQ